eukprot:GHVT01068494.1.p1 GENE.GHVT01068494.1~~GHVT01068494.1.p1  ORF type:complete len:175 (-),score=32.00 GHVT01068494.1:3049-3573(-)
MSPSGSVVASSTWALSSIPTAAAPLVQPANGSELGSGAAVCAEATKVEVEDTTRMNLMQPAPSLPSSSQVQPSQRIDNGEGVEPFPTSPPAASSFPPTDLTAAVDELVPLLSIGLNEAVRQVSHHCAERGLVIEKIWSTYVELFDRVLSEMRRTHERHKIKAKSGQNISPHTIP